LTSIEKDSRAVPTTDIAQRLAEVDAQIADSEIRIVEQQKRVENMLARGLDVAQMRAMIAVMTDTLAYLEAYRVELQRHLRSHAQGRA
jgi:hypothetical protein